MIPSILLETTIVCLLAILFIAYYYQLYLGSKLGKLMLILEVGIRAVSFTYLIFEKSLSGKDLIYLIPTFLSITLFIAKGWLARLLFGFMSLMIIFILSHYLWTIYK